MVEERGDGNDELKISKQDFFNPLPYSYLETFKFCLLITNIIF
jgi:hypothetical protein